MYTCILAEGCPVRCWLLRGREKKVTYSLVGMVEWRYEFHLYALESNWLLCFISFAITCPKVSSGARVTIHKPDFTHPAPPMTAATYWLPVLSGLLAS